MIKKAQDLDTSNCPVPDEMLGRLYRSRDAGVIQTVSSLPAVQRARLAVFCYGRAHLNEMAMAIASTCDRETLVDIAHRVGETLYVQSQERRKQAAIPEQVGRRSITLASSASLGETPRAFFDDEPVDEIAPEELDGEAAEAFSAAEDRAPEDAREHAYPALVVGF